MPQVRREHPAAFRARYIATLCLATVRLQQCAALELRTAFDTANVATSTDVLCEVRLQFAMTREDALAVHTLQTVFLCCCRLSAQRNVSSQRIVLGKLLATPLTRNRLVDVRMADLEVEMILQLLPCFQLLFALLALVRKHFRVHFPAFYLDFIATSSYLSNLSSMLLSTHYLQAITLQSCTRSRDALVS